MLGKTAGGLYWMFRYLERAENTARLLDAGFRIALTRSNEAESEWQSVIATSAAQADFEAKYDAYNSRNVINYLLRDADNANSVLSIMRAARNNARLVRTALTTEVWTAVNDAWMQFAEILKSPIREVDLPDVLSIIRQQSALVRGALIGTMLRKDSYRFCQLGTMIERADNTARIIDVKYFALLPSPAFVGGRLDNVQWETLLRSVSAHRSFRWAVAGEYSAPSVASFLILDRRMPRSLAYCAGEIRANLQYLADEYQMRQPSHDMSDRLANQLSERSLDTIFDQGLHEFLRQMIDDIAALGAQVELDYRFTN